MTIKEIAQLAGVSTMTVSNVINKKYSKVSKKTVDKVNEVIEEYHYIPNLTARTLSAQSSKIVALLVPMVEYDTKGNFFADPYTSQLVGILETQIRARGYFAMIRSVTNVKETCKFLNSWKIDGAIFILPNFDNQIDELMKKNKIPMVFIDSLHENDETLSINIPDYKGSYLATKYLINKGHKEIAFVSMHKGNPLLTLRYNGYVDALRENNIEVKEENIIEQPISFEGGIEAGKIIADRKNISAVITTADVVAIGIVYGSRLSGLRVPEDLSVIGYDNLTISRYSNPKITTIDQHITEKGEQAVELLFDRIDNINKLPNKILVDVELVERQSVTTTK